MDISVYDSDGDTYDYTENNNNDITEIVIDNLSIHNKSVIVEFEEFKASENDKGFYLLPDTPQSGSFLVYFKKNQDCHYGIDRLRMPMFAVSGKKSYLVVVSGMENSLKLNTGVKDGAFYIYPEFVLDKFGLYESIKIEIIKLNSYCSAMDIAKVYREYQLKRGCISISERSKNNPVLDYMADSIEVRIRMGWKPTPSPIDYQTEENEPEMHVACTFERVKDLIDEMKSQGIEKAQITLVGWNKSGHDGRWPQIFPVDSRLGGEAKLKELIDYAKSNNYLLACHTNSTDAYSIADDWDINSILRKENGEIYQGFNWSGGKSYMLCPKCAEKIAERELPRVKKVGFNGALYIDVLTAIAPIACFDRTHPMSKRDTVNCWKKIMQKARDLFGAFSSEGGFLYAPHLLDYAYYSCWKQDIFDKGDDFFDIEIPLWQMVYNGIILSNAYTNTTNATIKDKKTLLKSIEYNSRQTFYLYSKFLSGSDIDNWLGAEDITCEDDEKLKYAVSKIKEGYEINKKTSKLKKCFIEDYQIVTDDIHRVLYTDGTVVTVDYNSLEYSII